MDDDLVDGDGWISDESSFYGDEATKSELEQEASRELTLPHFPFAHIVEKQTKSLRPPNAKKDENVADFLKSRPQIAAHEKSTASLRSSVRRKDSPNTRGEEAADLLHNDRFKCHPAAWQQSETINEFLKRLPVADPATASVGPWIWVSSPQSPAGQKKHKEKEDTDQFLELGVGLLDAFTKRQSQTEAENAGKAPATITRHMRPHRDRLGEDILEAAVKTGTTCGKWMLFPGPEDLPRFWRVVAEATTQSKLGPVSKVATYDPFDGKHETLICVYTYDFTDMADVRRVLDELLGLGLCTRDGKPIYYKCDAYTYLGISSDNSYKLRASLFSSSEVLDNEAKVLANGPVARLQKRNRTMDTFFSV